LNLEHSPNEWEKNPTPSQHGRKSLLSEIKSIYLASRKPQDIFWNVYIARPIAAAWLVLLRRTPITPNQLTFLGLACFFGTAAILVFVPGWSGMLWGALALEISYILDCSDGQLARLKNMTSKAGAFLDFLIDEIKALVLVGACSLRLWRTYDDERALLLGLLGLFLVSMGTSLTTFVRRPEYAGEEIKHGVITKTAIPWRSPIRLVIWSVNSLFRWIVHYPSWFVYIALLDGLEQVDAAYAFLLIFLSVYALYVLRTSLGIFLKLASPSFYSSSTADEVPHTGSGKTNHNGPGEHDE
jgi:phosphatidylglycerophosphate synthase